MIQANSDVKEVLKKIPNSEQAFRNAFVVTRTFDAPRALMFEVWTDPQHIGAWLAPKGMKSNYAKTDIRTGGMSHYYMTMPDGGKMWGKIEYIDIKPIDSLLYMQHFSDEQGGVTRHPMSPTWPLYMLTKVEFEDLGEKSQVVLSWAPVDATAEEQETFDQSHAGMNQGWAGSFEQLTAYLAEIQK